MAPTLTAGTTIPSKNGIVMRALDNGGHGMPAQEAHSGIYNNPGTWVYDGNDPYARP